MLRNGLRHCGAQPGLGRGLAGGRGQVAGVQRVPGQRAGQVPVAVQAGVQRGGVRDLLLGDMCRELRRAVKAQPAGRPDVAAVDRVTAGLVQGEQVVVKFQVGEVEAGHPAHRVQRQVQRPRAAAQPAAPGRCGPGTE